MTCSGTGKPVKRGHCSECDRFAPVHVAEGARMPRHTRARALTDDEVAALIPRLPWEGAQERAMAEVVSEIFKEESDA